MKKLVLLVISVLVLACAHSGKPKDILIKGKLAPNDAAIVHPTSVPGGMMLIRFVGEHNTYNAMIGWAGSVYVPPGTYEFNVEVRHGFSVQDAGGPAWTVPTDTAFAPLKKEGDQSLLVKKGISLPKGTVKAGKTYEIKFGFDRSNPERPTPVTWLSEIPGVNQKL